MELQDILTKKTEKNKIIREFFRNISRIITRKAVDVTPPEKYLLFVFGSIHQHYYNCVLTISIIPKLVRNKISVNDIIIFIIH